MRQVGQGCLQFLCLFEYLPRMKVQVVVVDNRQGQGGLRSVTVIAIVKEGHESRMRWIMKKFYKLFCSVSPIISIYIFCCINYKIIQHYKTLVEINTALLVRFTVGLKYIFRPCLPYICMTRHIKHISTSKIHCHLNIKDKRRARNISLHLRRLTAIGD